MELIPAIDLLGGQVVRLTRGRYDQVTVYDDDPAAVARRFASEGARRLHVVDLDGARAGRPENIEAVRAVLEATDLEVQVGGGIRTAEAAERWLEEGAARVIVGTAAVEHGAMVRDLCARHPGGVVVAVDARDGEVSVEGWTRAGGRSLHELASEVDAWGAAAILYTDIDRDGTRQGPAVASTAALQARVRATVIASGGIGSLDDLRALNAAGVRACVCGRALYSGTFTVGGALSALAGS